MNSGRVMNLRVTIPAESRRMNVGKDVIRILGSPAYICVLQRKDSVAYKIPSLLSMFQQIFNQASMNMWGLTPEFLDVLEEGFKEFFEKEVPGNPLKA